jgi:hypothetical protein
VAALLHGLVVASASVYFKSAKAIPLVRREAVSAMDVALAYGQDLAVCAIWGALLLAIVRCAKRRGWHPAIFWIPLTGFETTWITYMLFHLHFYSLFGIPLNLEALGDIDDPAHFGSSVRSLAGEYHTYVWLVFVLALPATFLVARLRAVRELPGRLFGHWAAVARNRLSVGLAGTALIYILWVPVDSYELRKNDLVELASSGLRVGAEVGPLSAEAGHAVLGQAPDLTSFHHPDSIVVPPIELRDFKARFRQAHARRPMNIVFVVLESMVAPTIARRHGLEASLPYLTALEGQSISFSDYSSVFPLSMKSLITLFCSIHPIPVRRTMTYINPSLDCRSVSEIAVANGYRAAIFHSGRFSYTDKQRFFRGRGLDPMVDAENNPLRQGYASNSWGVQEEATIERLLQWVDESPRSPMMILYVPVSGHHPFTVFNSRYRLHGGGKPGRYKNSLRYTDDMVRRLIEGFEARNLARDTLFVIVGDHGIGLNIHPNNWIHSAEIFEENVKTLGLWYQPGLIEEGIDYPYPVQHPDQVPSLLDLLGWNAPDRHEGVSIFRPYPEKMVIHYTVRSKRLASLRDRHLKALLDLRNQHVVVFDLERDPGEENPLRDRHLAFAEHTRLFFETFIPNRLAFIVRYPRVSE